MTYTRGDTLSFASDGVKINARERGTKPGDKGKEEVVSADVIVLATGFKRPSVDMLPEDLFPTEGERSYERPNLYLQNFCTEDASIVLTNASYHDAVGLRVGWDLRSVTGLTCPLLVQPTDWNSRQLAHRTCALGAQTAASLNQNCSRVTNLSPLLHSTLESSCSSSSTSARDLFPPP